MISSGIGFNVCPQERTTILDDLASKLLAKKMRKPSDDPEAPFIKSPVAPKIFSNGHPEEDPRTEYIFSAKPPGDDIRGSRSKLALNGIPVFFFGQS